MLKKSRFVVMLAFAILFLMMPLGAHAANVKVSYKGVTKKYPKKITTAYVNGQRISIASTPIFMKSGSYMGTVNELLKKSSLKVGVEKVGQKITLTSGDQKLELKNGSTDVILNGVKEKKALGAIVMKSAYYEASKKSRWVVPLKSVCKRLGITYNVKDGAIYLTKANTGSTSGNSTTPANTAPETNTTATQATLPATSKQVVLVLDAGHGGQDSGANGKLYKEKNLNLAIVLGAKKFFDKDTRFKVYYTRTADTYPSLEDRCKLANAKKADLFICVHNNYASTSATGTETLYNNSRNATTKKNGITSKNLATYMQKAAVKSTGFTDRGLVNRTGLRVLNKTNMPACLIEYGFISNANQEKVIHANTARYGADLYKAIVSYMQLKGRIK
jgi:N-acetylmuramoyl-L-alanine amidase